MKLKNSYLILTTLLLVTGLGSASATIITFNGQAADGGYTPLTVESIYNEGGYTIYYDPDSLRIHTTAGKLDTDDFLFRSNEHVIDGVWEGEAQVTWYQQDIRSAPEPSTLLLMAIGLIGIGLVIYMKKAKH